MRTQPRTEQIKRQSSNLEDWITGAVNQLQDISTRVENIEGLDLQDISSTISSLESQVLSLTDDVVLHSSEISTLNTQLQTLEARVLALESPALSFTLNYDAFGSLESLLYENGDEVIFTYDSEGNISQISTPKGIKTLNYDTEGNLLGVTVT